MRIVRAGDIDIPVDEIRLRFSRASGPGGQNVNRRDTRVEAIFDLGASRALSTGLKRRARERLSARLDANGCLRVVASSERTQAGNRRVAFERLGSVLEKALRPPPPPRKKTKPSKAARERRLDRKVKHSKTKRLRRAPSREE